MIDWLITVLYVVGSMPLAASIVMLVWESFRNGASNWPDEKFWYWSNLGLNLIYLSVGLLFVPAVIWLFVHVRIA